MNFSRDHKYPQQRRSFHPKTMLTRQGLKSTVRHSQSTVQSTARRSGSTASRMQSTAKSSSKIGAFQAMAKWIWKPKQQEESEVSKEKNTSKSLTRFDYVDAYGRLKSVLAWDFQKH